MRARGLLAVFLLAVTLCFVPVLGHGEISRFIEDSGITTSYGDHYFLEARVNYMMDHRITFLNIRLNYDPTGAVRKVMKLPEGVDTKGKI